jgi:hypothetical protein
MIWYFSVMTGVVSLALFFIILKLFGKGLWKLTGVQNYEGPFATDFGLPKDLPTLLNSLSIYCIKL